jgi:hypothetical protein
MTSQTKTDLLKTLADGAVTLAAGQPWDQITLSDLCAQCGLTLVDCARATVTKAHVAAYLDAAIDQAMLASQSKVDRSQSVRDRLFDVLMSRFDALEDNRNAWMSILSADNRDMMSSLARRARRARSAAWALEASGVNAGDMRGAGRVVGLARILRLVETVWLSDSSELAKTMARLDQELRKGEEWVERINAASDFFKPKPAVEPTL